MDREESEERKKAKEILSGNMSENSEEYINEFENLKGWILDAMIEYGDVMSDPFGNTSFRRRITKKLKK
jgi:hypothetical protein